MRSGGPGGTALHPPPAVPPTTAAGGLGVEERTLAMLPCAVAAAPPTPPPGSLPPPPPAAAAAAAAVPLAALPATLSSSMSPQPSGTICLSFSCSRFPPDRQSSTARCLSWNSRLSAFAWAMYFGQSGCRWPVLPQNGQRTLSRSGRSSGQLRFKCPYCRQPAQLTVMIERGSAHFWHVKFSCSLFAKPQPSFVQAQRSAIASSFDANVAVRKTVLSFLECFHNMFVPSLSWQNDRL